MVRILNPLLLMVILSVTLISAQYNQKVIFYTNGGCTGVGKQLTESYAPDLTSLDMDNKAYSVYLTGNWLFYDLKTYNPNEALMEFAFGPSNFCLNFKDLGAKASSARFAGSPTDYRSDTLTLYTGTYFQGEEEYTYIDLPTLNLDRLSSSLIVTGVSPWTLYDSPDFQGTSICVKPPNSNDFTPAFVHDINTLNVPHNTIRSVKKGCFGQKQIGTDNLTQGGLFNLTHVDPIPLPTGRESRISKFE